MSQSKDTIGLNSQSALALYCPNADLTNPLLALWETPFQTPPFSKILPEHYTAAFDAAIECSRGEVAKIVENPEPPTFENTIVALERQGGLLSRVSSVFFALLSACTSDKMEAIAMEIQPKLTALSNDISLNQTLFERVKAVYQTLESHPDAVGRRLIENTYKSFERGGAALSPSDKELYRSYTTELSAATLRFGQNSLAATNAFSITLTERSQLEGLPETLVEQMAQEAKARNTDGWVVTLKYPSMFPFMTYSPNREIKERLWRASSTLALGGEHDNSENILTIVNLRLKIAQLFGYSTYADYALQERMAQTSETVKSFLEELLAPTLDKAHSEYQSVVEFAKGDGLTSPFAPWDFAYYSDRYKNKCYAVNDRLIKPYLELDSVVRGVFLLATKLYGITFTQRTDIDTFDSDMTIYQVEDGSGQTLAILYLDFFPRASKRSGAWMTEFRGTSVEGGVEQRPLVTLTMNFTKPTPTTPSLLTFAELETLLHEFGHGLHSILARGEFESLNGTNVYRDFVELPSQLLENWATESEFLNLWAVHYQSGEAIPQHLIDKIIAAKGYNAAYLHLRQLSFGLLDMAWHSLQEPYCGAVEPFEKAATAPTQILPPIEGSATSTSFGHIFSGGYAAGYYSYKWAEVLEADTFARFKRDGIFNMALAKEFREKLLSKGDQKHPMELYIDFAGEKPNTQALLNRIVGGS